MVSKNRQLGVVPVNQGPGSPTIRHRYIFIFQNVRTCHGVSDLEVDDMHLILCKRNAKRVAPGS